MKTGQGELRSTYSVVEPSTISMIRLWPYAPMNRQVGVVLLEELDDLLVGVTLQQMKLRAGREMLEVLARLVQGALAELGIARDGDDRQRHAEAVGEIRRRTHRARGPLAAVIGEHRAVSSRENSSAR